MDDAIEAFRRYQTRVQPLAHNSYNPDLAAEVSEKLLSMRWLLTTVRDAEGRHTREVREALFRSQKVHTMYNATIANGRTMLTTGSPDILKEVVDSSEKNGVVIKTGVESFYHFAFRVREILNHHTKPLPGIGSFECIEIRDVRNHLLVHPERHTQLYAQSWSWDTEGGPALKNFGPFANPEHVRDQGLYVNARSFEERFVTCVDSALPLQS